MKETIYIFSNGRLKRKDNTLFFETEDGNKKFIPVENTKEIFMFGENDLNSKVLNFLSQNEIVLSYFNYFGYYAGSFYPREHYNSGFMILKQADHYTDETKRKFIAKRFIEGAVKNCLKILKYYERRGKDLIQHIDDIEETLAKLEEQESIEKAMAIEGQIKQIYYNTFNNIIDNPEFSFERRTKRPPRDYLNTLISFSNSMIYTYVLSEIYQTHLDPRIGFLHTTNFRRFTLNLDVAEIFKPVIGDRTIFSVINKKIITENDFERQLNGILLKDTARKKFIQYMEERLKQTIKHSGLKKQVSYRRLMRLELYKLEKHLMGEDQYKPFVMEW
ncbi:CRISPR-associated protein Cas1 [Candidatus Scalindua japonica]|uniref:CRISPR-associated endonuclease Cas1 n=1 Tax=Candidatus Scalindua japonica TaxID=1284222 RepID=A0A286TU57_9BACT|nr:type I-B CRISPR-associated endonuclease Cas1b [Candidatus Scalindua japonica]GAX59416.1 CRISPR-associated protein Cas1 [Candidatus Scalindua japonica]